MSEQIKKTRAKDRPKRVPIGTRSVLPGVEIPGFVTRYVNDTGNRIAMFEEAGYTKVNKTEIESPRESKAQDPSEMGTAVRFPVGDNVYAFLMKIPKEFYDEDQVLKQQKIDDIEESYDPTRQVVANTYGHKLHKIKR